MKKLILILSIIVFFFGFKFVNAEVIINEIMYDLDGADIDWVEIYNPDSIDVDLTSLKLLISNSDSNHGINKYSGSQVLHQDEYGVIVVTSQISSFVSKWGDSGNLFTSSFSLPNTSGKIEINNGDKLSPMSSVTYNSSQGATGDGNSLQLISGGWKSALPTPGLENETSSEDDEEDTEEDDSSDADEDSSESETATETKATATPTLKTKILAKTLAFAGQPAEFSLDVKYGSFTYTTGKYFWNFGDGDSREVINQPGRIFHTYFYPGEYAVSSEYYKSYLSQVPDVVSKITIKVVPLTVSISKVGDAKDFFIELTNNSSYEIDISRWAINANGKVFVFPKNTAILSKKQTTVSGRITGFVSGDERNLKLISSAGDVVFDYNPPIVQTEIIKEAPAPAPVSAPVKIPTVETQNNNVVEVETPEVEIPDQTQILPTQIPADILPAAVVQSDIDVKESSNKYLFLGGLAGFLIITGGFVYFLRRNRVPANLKEGSDFKILDE